MARPRVNAPAYGAFPLRSAVEDLDFEHLSECVDKWCAYCRDEEPERDPEVQAWLDAIESQHLSQPAA